MADTTNKKARKCGNCGQEGHDKRKCPTLASKKDEVKPETKDEPQTVYGVLIKEDNGDDVHTWFTLYASLDGLMGGLKKTIDDFTKEHEDDDDDEDVKNMAPTSKYYKHLFYYNESETFKNVPVPTKEYVEGLLNKKTYLNDTLLIKTGSGIGGSACFACEISVFMKTVNP